MSTISFKLKGMDLLLADKLTPDRDNLDLTMFGLLQNWPCHIISPIRWSTVRDAVGWTRDCEVWVQIEDPRWHHQLSWISYCEINWFIPRVARHSNALYLLLRKRFTLTSPRARRGKNTVARWPLLIGCFHEHKRRIGALSSNLRCRFS